MKELSDKIIIGKIGAPYGVKGWIKVHAYTDFDSTIFDYSPWHLQDSKGRLQIIDVEEGKPHAGGLVAKFKGIETPEAASTYTNQLVVIDRSQLPELQQDEFYWSDLIGLSVINQQNQELGTVAYLMETGSNDVIVIKDVAGKEHAIPYLKDTVIKQIDLEAKQILVDWELI